MNDINQGSLIYAVKTLSRRIAAGKNNNSSYAQDQRYSIIRRCR